MLTMAGTLLVKLLDGVAGAILSRWVILAVLLGATGYYSYAYGNAHGPYAVEYKKIVKELADKNAVLAKQAVEDAKAIAKADAKRDAAVSKLVNLKTCKATKSQAKAINSVRE